MMMVVMHTCKVLLLLSKGFVHYLLRCHPEADYEFFKGMSAHAIIQAIDAADE
jgi:hypothetical protein